VFCFLTVAELLFGAPYFTNDPLLNVEVYKIGVGV
jgi:hypothetical protein